MVFRMPGGDVSDEWKVPSVLFVCCSSYCHCRHQDLLLIHRLLMEGVRQAPHWFWTAWVASDLTCRTEPGRSIVHISISAEQSSFYIDLGQTSQACLCLQSCCNQSGSSGISCWSCPLRLCDLKHKNKNFCENTEHKWPTRSIKLNAIDMMQRLLCIIIAPVQKVVQFWLLPTLTP